jgi:UDP-N-acetylmuramate--alanine ligase
MRIPFHNIKTLHFVGIGGIGMSGIAEVLHNLGYKISGSDISNNQNISRLKNLGIEIKIGHDKKNILNAEVIVISTAVSPQNPEVLAARDLRIPVIHRADMLAEIMRLKFSVAVAGTHGKTTTTSLSASLLDVAGFDPTVVNGGIINAYKTNARLGTGDWAVVEADESDGSFVKLPATIGIITNIDLEHMEHYKDFENLKNHFITFLKNIPFYGLGILCSDHPVVAEIAKNNTDRRILTYGLKDGADIRGFNLRYYDDRIVFDVDIKPTTVKSRLNLISKSNNIEIMPDRLKDLSIPMMGEHNVQNALSIVAIARELGIPDHVLRKSFDIFKGVKRRFTVVGVVEGIKIVDDYAHHPVEIQAVINAAKKSCKGNVISVIQPHRYTRLRDLFEDFALSLKGSDKVVIAPVYPAGEDPIDKINSSELAKLVRKNGFEVYEVQDQQDLALKVSEIAKNGDIILCMGAGSITNWACFLPNLLGKIKQDSVGFEKEFLKA